jgi:hypothetical protein
MFFSVDSGTLDAPSYPAIAVWANPAETGHDGRKWYSARAWRSPLPRSKMEKVARAGFLPDYSSSLI